MRATRWLPALLAAALAGCSGELVGGGQRDVDAMATGGGGAGSARSPAQSRSAPAVGPVVFQSGTATGTLRVEARVSLVRASTPAPVGTGSATVRVDGGDTARIASGRVPRGGYDAARVVFTRVTADVGGGLTVGGVELTGRVDVGIAPGDSVVVEMPVAVAAGGSPVRLLVELDAATWLRAADPFTRTVPPAAFRGAVRLRAM